MQGTQHIAAVEGGVKGRECRDGLCPCRMAVVERDSWWLSRENLGFAELGGERGCGLVK